MGPVCVLQGGIQRIYEGAKMTDESMNGTIHLEVEIFPLTRYSWTIRRAGRQIISGGSYDSPENAFSVAADWIEGSVFDD